MQRKEKDGIIKYWKRIFQLYLSWSVINFISVSLINRNLCVENVQTCIYQIFFNGYGVLWYLWGILIALPLLIKLRDGGGKTFVFSCNSSIGLSFKQSIHSLWFDGES